MTPYQYEQAIRRRLYQCWTEQHAHLLFWRSYFEAERIERGNKITLDKWPPRERTPRRKREPNA